MDESVDLSLKKDFIKKQACFAQFTDEEIVKLASLFREKQFKAGEEVVTEGDPVDSVFLIIRGTADVRHVTIKDHAPHIQSLATLNAGDAIGLNETGFYSLSGIRTATVVALTDLVTLCMSMPQFHGFALEYSHVSEVMRKNASGVLHNSNNEF